MEIRILKTHKSGKTWFHAGSEAEAEGFRARDLIRLGLAEEVTAKPEAPARETKVIPEPETKPRGRQRKT